MALMEQIIAFSPKFFARVANENQKSQIKCRMPCQQYTLQLSRHSAPSPEFSGHMVKNQKGTTHTIEIWVAADV